MSNSPGLWERVVGAPWAAGGWIVGTCPSCIACPCNELRWPEIDTACPWRALLIVEGTWAAEVVADICPLLPGTWWTPPLVCCNVVGLWCNVVGICAIPDGIWGTWGNWASSWLAYWQGVRGRLATEWAMLPACFRNRALRLLNHTWNTKTFCVSTVNSSLSNYLFFEKKNSIQVFVIQDCKDGTMALFRPSTLCWTKKERKGKQNLKIYDCCWNIEAIFVMFAKYFNYSLGSLLPWGLSSGPVLPWRRRPDTEHVETLSPVAPVALL